MGCRDVLPKRSLVRLVRTPQGVQVDPTGKLPGRGAYLHDRLSCWERGLKGALAHALKIELTDEERTRLITFAATLPPGDTGPEEATAETSPPDGQGHA